MQDFQSDSDDLWVTSVQGSLNRDNELWDDWQHFGSTLFEHVENTLHGQESVWVHFFSNTFEKDWQVMMVVKLLDLDLPVDLVLWCVVLDRHGQISAVVEEAELTHGNLPSADSASYWLLDWRPHPRDVQARALTSKTITLLQDGRACGCN